MSQLGPTPRTTLGRKPDRGSHDRACIDAILDEALYCHVSYHEAGQTFAIPMLYARVGDALYLHGSTANRTLRALCNGASACLNVTLLDGLVLGRSAFRTSVNYRSVVLFGSVSEVTDPVEKLEAMRAIVEATLPERWPDVRPPSSRELRMTRVVRLPLLEASAKIRSGPPADDEADYARACWAGVLPLHQTTGTPVDDPRLSPDVPKPRYVTHYARPGGPSRSDGESGR
jgi:nitroimidazol reductase NimA-like FMN-containing flavoprotein (pyridoxamine 5'-phosphate oxidase superfamily)